MSAGLTFAATWIASSLRSSQGRLLARERHRIACVDVEDVAGRFCTEVRGEEIDGLGDVFGVDRAFQQRALAVDLVKLLFADLVGSGALLAPLAGPDFRAAQNSVGVDRVDAN